MAEISADHDIPEVRQRVSALLARRRDYRQEVLDLTRRYEYVVFYGCGAILSSIVDTWSEQVGRKIDFCCDSDPAKWGREFCGARCLSPEELAAIKDRSAVFVTVGSFVPVYETLVQRGFPSVNVIYKYDLAASAFLAGCRLPEVAADLTGVYADLADRRSREVFAAIVNRVLGSGEDVRVMADVCEPNQYFPPDVIRLSEREALVDVGAYDGDTIRDFVGRTAGRFESIYSFEVDAANFRLLEGTVGKLPERDRIKIFNLGIWDRECDITFHIGHSQSTIGTGAGRGHVVRLDDVLGDRRVSLIKMDIEGAEPRALLGAADLIRRQKPKMAVCTYHDFRHLWEVPRYLKKLVPEYRIYLRHHTNLEYETVCYAVC